MNLYTKESGTGQPMVLLHGNGEDSSYFVNQMSFFESKYHVIAVDTRGHGRSPRGQGAFTLERFAEDLKEFLDRRGLRRIVLLGFSDGGNIALIFALKYPGYIDRLILNGANLNPFGMKPSVLADVAREYVGVVGKLWMQKCGIDQMCEKLRMAAGRMRIEKQFSKDNKKLNEQKGLNKQQKKSCQKEKNLEKKRKACERNIHQKELLSLMLFEPWIRPELLHRLKMPVLVVAGSDDMIRERHTRQIARSLPNARLRLLEGTHFVAAENPDAFNQCVASFLEQTQGGELAQMSRIWGSRRAGRLEKEKIRRAAVLVPLIQKGGEYHVVFEVRAGSLKTQPGEICFPGGAVERGETPKQAAVRETMEELLISRRQIRVIAPLDVLEAAGAMEIFPFLGALQGYRWSYSEAEVDHTFSVPLRWFAEQEPERYETELVTVPEERFPFEDVPGGHDYHWRRGHYDVYFYRREEGIIWGMTAKILRSLAEMYREDILLNDQVKRKSIGKVDSGVHDV